MMSDPQQPPISDAKRKAFAEFARRFQAAKPEGDKNLVRASKLYGNKESSDGKR